MFVTTENCLGFCAISVFRLERKKLQKAANSYANCYSMALPINHY